MQGIDSRQAFVSLVLGVFELQIDTNGKLMLERSKRTQLGIFAFQEVCCDESRVEAVVALYTVCSTRHAPSQT